MASIDALIVSVDNALRTLAGAVHAARPSPSEALAQTHLSESERRLAGAMMRVNHVGEVCAQALYQAQALNSASAETRARMAESAREESDHLAWTRQRLAELGARPSALNALWYGGAFVMGLAAGRLGDRVSLGFVVETERQVEQHLADHLYRLPAADTRSRAIVEQMRDDERRHAEMAAAQGAARMPLPVRWAMRAAARVMTLTAHHI